MKVRWHFKYWRSPLRPCLGHEPAFEYKLGNGWPWWQYFAIGPLIPLHRHNNHGPCVLAWRVWIYTRRGGRLIDLTFDDRVERSAEAAA